MVSSDAVMSTTFTLISLKITFQLKGEGYWSIFRKKLHKLDLVFFNSVNCF